MVKVRSLESVPFSRYLCLCNVLRICDIRAIPIYRVYRLYDRPMFSDKKLILYRAAQAYYQSSQGQM